VVYVPLEFGARKPDVLVPRGVSLSRPHNATEPVEGLAMNASPTSPSLNATILLRKGPTNTTSGISGEDKIARRENSHVAMAIRRTGARRRFLKPSKCIVQFSAPIKIPYSVGRTEVWTTNATPLTYRNTLYL
jgi:hypothetical protein